MRLLSIVLFVILSSEAQALPSWRSIFSRFKQPTCSSLLSEKESPSVARKQIEFQTHLADHSKIYIRGSAITDVQGQDVVTAFMTELQLPRREAEVLARFWTSGHNVILAEPASTADGRYDNLGGFAPNTKDSIEAFAKLPNYRLRPRGTLLLFPGTDHYVMEHEWRHSEDQAEDRLGPFFALVQDALARGSVTNTEAHRLWIFAMEYSACIHGLKVIEKDRAQNPTDPILKQTETMHLTYIVRLGLEAMSAMKALKLDGTEYRKIKTELLRLEGLASPSHDLRVEALIEPKL